MNKKLILSLAFATLSPSLHAMNHLKNGMRVAALAVLCMAAPSAATTSSNSADNICSDIVSKTKELNATMWNAITNCHATHNGTHYRVEEQFDQLRINASTLLKESIDHDCALSTYNSIILLESSIKEDAQAHWNNACQYVFEVPVKKSCLPGECTPGKPLHQCLNVLVQAGYEKNCSEFVEMLRNWKDPRPFARAMRYIQKLFWGFATLGLVNKPD